MKTFLKLILCTSGLMTSVGTGLAAKKEVWVYTSMYKEYIGPIEKAFEQKNPNIDLKVFQAGSEKIQAKVEAELMAKKTQADLIVTSDLFWTMSLKTRDLLWTPTNTEAIRTNYNSAMVIIVHKDLPVDKRPKTFEDLTKSEFKASLQFASPLESGTAFSTVSYLKEKYGWTYFEKLKENRLASSGGNSAVIQKVESGEKKIGVALLENALASKKRGSPIDIIYPADGAIPIPSVQAVLGQSKAKDEALLFGNFLLSDEGQQLIRNGYMYSVNKSLPPPEGAIAYTELTQKSMVWTPDLLTKVAKESKEIKKKFSELILE